MEFYWHVIKRKLLIVRIVVKIYNRKVLDLCVPDTVANAFFLLLLLLLFFFRLCLFRLKSHLLLPCGGVAVDDDDEVHTKGNTNEL